MWRDYIGLTGTAVAVVNGLLAIIIALLPVRRSVVKLRLGVAALVLAGLGLGAAAFSKHYERVQHDRQATERSEIREKIETFILEGRTLLSQIRDAQRELPSRASDEWAQRAEIYLRDKLGERYVVRFRREVDDLYGDAAIAPARLGYWRAVRNRVVNLEKINAEFPPPTETPAAATEVPASQ
jgi:hypothetical protein